MPQRQPNAATIGQRPEGSIEFGVEGGFSPYERLLMDPDLFVDHRPDAERAAETADDFGREISHGATVEQPKLAAEQQRTLFIKRIAQHPEPARVQAEFDALENHG